MVNFLFNKAKKGTRTMSNVASYYDTILTVHQQDELNDLIRQAIETNEDIHTTEADIRYFQTQEYLQRKGLVQ